MVDRHQVPARLERSEIDLEHLGSVGQDRGHDVARPDPLGPQCMDELVGVPQQFARPHLQTFGCDQGQIVGIFLGQGPKPEVTHGVPPLCACRFVGATPSAASES
jgi:hypothetical protein